MADSGGITGEDLQYKEALQKKETPADEEVQVLMDEGTNRRLSKQYAGGTISGKLAFGDNKEAIYRNIMFSVGKRSADPFSAFLFAFQDGVNDIFESRVGTKALGLMEETFTSLFPPSAESMLTWNDVLKLVQAAVKGWQNPPIDRLTERPAQEWMRDNIMASGVANKIKKMDTPDRKKALANIDHYLKEVGPRVDSLVSTQRYNLMTKNLMTKIMGEELASNPKALVDMEKMNRLHNRTFGDNFQFTKKEIEDGRTWQEKVDRNVKESLAKTDSKQKAPNGFRDKIRQQRLNEVTELESPEVTR